MRHRAADLGRAMVWPAVARQYLESFQRARNEFKGDFAVRSARALTHTFGRSAEPGVSCDDAVRSARVLAPFGERGLPRKSLQPAARQDETRS
jgi:hypothetical protein